LAALKKTTKPASGHQASQLAAITELTIDVRHVEGKSNLVADALSRPDPPSLTTKTGTSANNLEVDDSAPSLTCLSPSLDSRYVKTTINAIKPGVNYRELADDQTQDSEVKAYRTAISGLKLKDVQFMDGSCSVPCDVSTGCPRPIVTKNWQKRIFDIFHGLAHPGATTTKKLISAKFVWHGLVKQITAWARQCIQCQQSKIQTHVKAPLQSFEPTMKRFEHVHIDLVGPLPESRGHKYLLTVMDRFTRWPEAVPIKDIETRTVAVAFIQNWIARFGVPGHITTDRGTQFISDLWASMSELLGTNLHPKTAYHPQSNGLVE